MLGIIRAILSTGLKIFAITKQTKPTTSELIMTIMSQLFPTINNAIKAQNMTTHEQFDAWLVTMDEATGTDAMALDIIKGMSAELEEQFFDHIIAAARVYGYWLIDGKGEHVVDLDAIAKALPGALG